MKTIAMALATVSLGLIAACSGSTDTATSGESRHQQSDVKPDSAIIEETNLADNFNQAWADLAAAQQAYDALGATENVTESTVTTEWINQVGDRLQELRAAWQTMKTEADQLPLPESFSVEGEMSRGTVDEYMIAYDAYITLQEGSYARTQQCIRDGGENFGCTFQEGIALLADPEYVTAWERLREATYAMFVEAGQPSP